MLKIPPNHIDSHGFNITTGPLSSLKYSMSFTMEFYDLQMFQICIKIIDGLCYYSLYDVHRQ